MTRVVIIGSRDLGQLLGYHLSQEPGVEVTGFFDDYRTVGESTTYGPILGQISEAIPLHQAGHFDAFILGVGYAHPEFRRLTFESLQNSIPAYSFIHASALIEPSVQIGDGVVVLPGCVVDHACQLNDNCLLNTGCVIAHDSAVGMHSFLGPGVCVAGFVSIGSSCFIGVGSTIIDNITIADGVQTGGGSLVSKDLLTEGLYYGVPAKLQRKLQNKVRAK